MLTRHSIQRTGNGSLKSSYPHAPRRPPPLGLRSDANLSTPSLPGRGPPPMRHPPGPPSMRTVSAASVTSWNAPYRERRNSNSTRTSSLTSVINMYYRVPPALRTAQFGPPVPPPRYYDYTEEFERTQSRSTTPVQPLAPVPTRAPSVQCPLVLREGSEEQVDAALGVNPDSTFFDEESEQDDSQLLLESGLLGYRQEADDQENYGQSPAGPQPTCTASDNPIEVSSSSNSVRRQMRGSDIDLLPSQIGRASVDTFRPSLDVESREIPLFSYPNYRTRNVSKENTSSPARQVQVHRGRTPTIRSEQGVILKDNAQEGGFAPGKYTFEETPRQLNTPTISVQSPTKWRYKSETTQDLLEVNSGADAYSDIPRRRIATTEPAKLCSRSDLNIDNPGEGSLSDSSDTHDLLQIVDSPRDAGSAVLSKMTSSEQRQSPCNSHEPAATNSHMNDDSPKFSTNDQNQYRRHRRNQATLNIITKNLPRDDDEVDHPEVSPSCSTVPLISPKPISPARELKVRNSIPQLMKALPPTPGDAAYVPLPTTMTVDDEEDDYTEVLLPYNFTRYDLLQSPRASLMAQPNAQSSRHSRNPLPELQKKLPKIRLKPKDTNAPAASNHRDSRPWNSDSNYPWCSKTTEIELGSVCGDKDNNRISFKQKLRLRGSRTVCGGTPPLGTVRHYPDALGSDVVANLANQQSKDLFSFSNSLSSAFRQVSRKLSHSSHDDPPPGTCGSPGVNTAATVPDRHSTTTAKWPRIVFTRAEGDLQPNSGSSDRYSSMKQRQRLKKRLSNLRGLLARSSRAQLRISPMEEVNIVESKGRDTCLESTFGLSNDHVKSKDFTTDVTQRPQFKRRMRARISKWARDTKAAVKQYGRRDRGVDVATRGGSRSTV